MMLSRLLIIDRWETLGVKPSVPALRGPGGFLVVAHAEKASLQGSQFLHNFRLGIVSGVLAVN